MSSIQNIQNSHPQLVPSQPASLSPHMNHVVNHSRLHFSWKFAQTILITPLTSTVQLAGRLIKLITWDVGKTATLKALGYHAEAKTFLPTQYLKTVRAVRDILFIPTLARSAFNDIVAKRENFVDDLQTEHPQSYLSIGHTKKFDLFSSYMHGSKTFEVIQPTGIQEFAAESDGDLNTVMASHFLKPGVMAINFGIPNLATFATEAREDGSVQTIKVDAKSLKREKMSYHSTNGKIQSGVFFVPTNLPTEALERFKAAAKKLEGRADITCVNTNCRVLKEAGFSIEGKNMDEVVFPTTMMEHLLFRNVIYTDLEGKKHKVHFDIINTTPQTLEEHFEKIDIAVLGTRLRHRRRNADNEENRKARGVAAKALIAQEKARLEDASPAEQNVPDLTKRKITVSVPSYLGDVIARIWGRHTIYEVDLSDKKAEIAQAFQGQAKLRPFPQQKPSFGTRLKRDIFFSRPMINFLRRHMMGRMDTLHLNTQDLFNHLKSTQGERLNYVVLDDKVVLAKINPNGNKKETHRKAADWALSKHALIAGRAEVYCSGEMWYDKVKQRFMMNKDSGTYMPNEEQLKIAAELANQIFKTNLSGNFFEVAAAA
jgi:hypothetical protein